MNLTYKYYEYESLQLKSQFSNQQYRKFVGVAELEAFDWLQKVMGIVHFDVGGNRRRIAFAVPFVQWNK